MELSQKIFRAAFNALTRKRQEENPAAVHLAEHQGRLTMFARMMTGHPIELMTAEEEGGFAGDIFFLPQTSDFSTDMHLNLQFYFYRIGFMSMQFKNRHGWQGTGQESLEKSRQMAESFAPQVLNQLFAEIPRLQDVFEALIPFHQESKHALFGKWFPLTFHEPIQPLTHDPQAKFETNATELEGKSREFVETLEVDQKAVEDFNLIHQFEKVDTLDEFKGTWRDFDGSDELEEHQEALQELDLSQTVRVNEPVHSILRSDFLRQSTIPESVASQQDTKFQYDEWDFKKKVFKKDYCKVFPNKFLDIDKGYVDQCLVEKRVVIHRLKRKINQFFNHFEACRNQITGPEIDLDRVVDMIADRKARLTPKDNIYTMRRRVRRDVSILILVDLSLSTDGYTQNQRILDIEKQALIPFAQVLDDLQCRVQIDGFYSQTRNHCTYQTYKQFDESWSKTRDRIGAMKPAGYTRIGPALRHAEYLLNKEPSRKKWVLVLSDGKPNDYDRYEGRYGIEDVKQAVRSLKKKGNHVFAIGVDPSVNAVLQLMFGHSSSCSLNHPNELPEALTHFYLKLSRA